MIGSFKNHCDERVSASVIELVEQCCFLHGIEATITKSPIGVGFISTHTNQALQAVTLPSNFLTFADF